MLNFRRRAAVLLLALACAAPARALLWWRDAVSAEWTNNPSQAWEAGAVWADTLGQEEPGLIFRALNDGANLYLSATADNREVRALLSGSFRQDITIWFFTPDRKKRSWGIRVPFSRLESSTAELADALRNEGSENKPMPEPELLPGEGGIPPDPREIGFRADFTGREPVYIIRVPVARVREANGKTVPIDFLSSKPAVEYLKRAEAMKAAAVEENRKALAEKRAEPVKFNTDVIGAVAQSALGPQAIPGQNPALRGNQREVRKFDSSTPRAWTPTIPSPWRFRWSWLARKP